MFQFPAFAPLCAVSGLQPDGLPHSETRGSMDICSSPRLIAACHVLLRLREPQASAVRPSFLLHFSSIAFATLNSQRATARAARQETVRGLSPRRSTRALNARSRSLLFRNNMSKIHTAPRKGRSRPWTEPTVRSKTVENKGLEPLTPCVQGRRSKPTELIPRNPCSPTQS